MIRKLKPVVRKPKIIRKPRTRTRKPRPQVRKPLFENHYSETLTHASETKPVIREPRRGPPKTTLNKRFQSRANLIRKANCRWGVVTITAGASAITVLCSKAPEEGRCRSILIDFDRFSIDFRSNSGGFRLLLAVARLNSTKKSSEK